LILMPDVNDILHIPLQKFSYKAEVHYQSLRLLLRWPWKGHNILHDTSCEQRKACSDIHPNGSGAEAAFEHVLSTLRGEDHGIRHFGPLSVSEMEFQPELEFQNILGDLWSTVVKPILDGLAFSVCCFTISVSSSADVLSILQGQQSEDELVHVWWCTTGFLTFLPIHAAGIYGEKAFPGSKLMDFVVSSYTPTLSSLITHSDPATLPNHQVLAVALPKESCLPGTAQELDCIANQVGFSNVKKLVESEATLENVIAGLKESSFVHFACHGVQDAKNPNESALLLAKSSRLTLSHLHHL
jgi:CHAT domain